MRALLTGSTGFLGSRVREALQQRGDQVLAVRHNTPPQLAEQEIDGMAPAHQFSRAIEAFGPDVVILIGSADTRADDPEAVDYLTRGNVQLPLRLCSAAFESGCRHIVHVGTSWQETGGDGYNPMDLYASSKQAALVMLEHFAHRGAQVIHLQLFDTYGPGDHRRKVLNLILESTARNEPIGLSPGHQLLHLVYVDDVVNAILQAAQLPKTGPDRARIFSVSSERAHSLRDVVAALEESGERPLVEFGARQYRDGEIMVPRSRFDWIPGWAPSVPLAVGLERCLSAIRQSNVLKEVD